MDGPFLLGERVKKKSGSAWQGKIVGWYSTKLTPQGYAVESEFHPGSVQIYPASALEVVAAWAGNEMMVDRWIAEFASISPVNSTGMDFRKAASKAVESGITPQQVLLAIVKLTRDEIIAMAMDRAL